MSHIHGLIEKYTTQIIKHRRYIHQNPELSGEEKKTAAYVAGILKEMDLEVNEHIGGYGVVALIRGNASGKCVGLRADIDALPIQEETGLSFASHKSGIMHACGHDCHTAMLLGAAQVLIDMKGTFPGCVKLVFQPAEEDPLHSGAKAMIAEGVLEEPRVDSMIGQHVDPSCSIGTVSVKNGSCTAASDRFYISIQGKNAHASTPDLGIDAIAIAGQVVTALQTVVSRQTSPLSSSVLTIGTIKGGERYNILPGRIEMEGTCRNTDPDIRNTMPQRMERIIKGITEAMGGTCVFNYVRGYSPTINDPILMTNLLSIAKEIPEVNIKIEDVARLGGEDFSFYSELVPSLYYWLGCTNRTALGTQYPLHNGRMIPDERILAIGTELLVRNALCCLKGSPESVM